MEDELFRAEAHARYIVTTNSLALALGLVVLFALSRIRLLLSPLATGLLCAALALFFAVDVLRWFLRGVRSVELGVGGIVLVIGSNAETRKVDAKEIVRILMTRRFGRRQILISISSGPGKAPRKLLISDDAFSREEFTSLMRHIEEAFSGRIEKPAAG